MDTQFILYKSIAIVLLACIAQVGAVQVTATITSSGLRGENAAVTCSWVKEPDDILFKLVIKSQSGSDYYVYFIGQNNQPAPQNNAQKDRLTVDSTTSTSTNVTMRISDLQCIDEQTYICSVEYNSLSQTAPSNMFKEDSDRLIIKVPPGSPNMTTIPASLSSGVLENDEVTATCVANTGRPNKGKISWKIFRHNNAEAITDGDSRVSDSTVQPGTGEDPCTERKRSVFKMKLTRSEQDFVIACFVLNDDFNSTMPISCGENSNSCKETETIRVLYGVSDPKVNREPQDDLYVGGTVTLTCTADGYPPATYSWVKVGDENKTLTATVENGQSRLTLTNLDDETDQGEYNCTASNNVLGTDYFVADSVNIAIYKTTTRPPTTTPTEADTTEGGNTGGTQQQTDDDDKTTIIIVVVVVVVVVLLIAIIVGVIFFKRRNSRKEIEEPPEKPYNNKPNFSHHTGQPDLVADDKKFHNPSLNNSFDMKNEDGLMYADLTYDNRPRSRKPMAINDTASDYSDIQMPQV